MKILDVFEEKIEIAYERGESVLFEIHKLVGKQYQRHPNYYLWGKQRGSI
jgi:hypothetical protein